MDENYFVGADLDINLSNKSPFGIILLLPILLIVMMSWTVFWVDPIKYDSQLIISATSMLSLVAFLFTLSNQIPEIGYLTSMDLFS